MKERGAKNPHYNLYPKSMGDLMFWRFVLKCALISGSSSCAKIYGYQKISDPPTILPLTVGGGGGSELVVFPSGPHHNVAHSC
jgi:hypothetical protein